ncbi:MAG: hypothetical protein RLZZ21_1381 [Planctomycetota bacterium]|jgi:transposase
MSATRERSKAKKATKKPANDPADTDAEGAAAEPTLAERERRHYLEIQQLEKECERLESDYRDKKHTASASKAAWEASVLLLREAIRRGPDPQLQLPLNDDWLGTPVDEALELSPRQAEILAEAGIATVRELDDLRIDGGGLQSLPGIGRATADRLEDMLLDWISANAPKESDASDSDEPERFDDDDQDEEEGDE